MTAEVEIAVVGAGPGGLSAALAAARAGARVVVYDGYPVPGGQYYRQPPERRMAQATRRQREGRALWEAARAAGVEIRSSCLAWNADSQRRLALSGPAGIEAVQAGALVLATGACGGRDPCPRWALPGVITPGAAQTLLYQGVLPGRRVLLAGSGPLLLVTAADLLHAGAEVVGVVEGGRPLRSGLRHAPALWGQWQRLAEGAESLLALARQGSFYRTGWGILAALGKDQVEGARIARLDANWRLVPGSAQQVECDTVCAGYSFVPFNALAKLAGAEMQWLPEPGSEAPLRDETMQTTVPGIYAAGDGAGIGGYRLAMLEGRIAGLSAARQLGYSAGDDDQARLRSALARERAFQRLYASLFTPGPGAYELARADTLVCRCEGITWGRLQEAIRSGATSLVEVKALARCGMGECQGRVCGAAVSHALAAATGKSLEEIGEYSVRPPLFSLQLGLFQKQGLSK